jgi:hypothetical protein
MAEEKNPVAVALGKLRGKGRKACAAKMTPEKRSESTGKASKVPLG